MSTAEAVPHPPARRAPPVRKVVTEIRPGREGDDLLELVIIHPGALPVEVYQQTIAGIQQNVRVLVFDLQSLPQYFGAMDADVVDPSIEQIVDAIWLELQPVLRPDLPLLVMGWSFGGVLAFELMRRNVFAGRRTKLILADSIAPVASLKRGAASMGNQRMMWWFSMYLSARRGINIRVEEQSGKFVTPDDRLQTLLTAAIEAGAMRADTSLDGFRKVFETFNMAMMRNVRIINLYQPKPMSAAYDTVLIKARTSLIPNTTDLGWKPLVKGRLTTMVSSSDHYSMLTEPSAVHWLAAVLNYLADAVLHARAELPRSDLRRLLQRTSSLIDRPEVSDSPVISP